MRLGISLKLVTFTMGIVLLVGGSIAGYSVYQGRQRILFNFDREAQEITAVIAGTVAKSVYFLDLYRLRVSLEEARVNPDITNTYVTDPDGVVLADGTRENSLRDQKLTDPFSREVFQSQGWISRIDGELLKVGSPILMPDGGRVGFLLVGFSLASSYESIRNTTRANLYITVACLAIGAVLAVILAMSFTRPIQSLVGASREIGRGKLDTRLAVNRNDELGLLAQSINQMAGALQRREADTKRADEQIKNQAFELEKANKDLRRREETQQLLKELSQDITRLDIDSLLKKLTDKVREILKADVSDVRILKGDSWTLMGVSGIDPRLIPSARTGTAFGRSGWIIRNRKPLLIPDTSQEQNLPSGETINTLGLRGYAGVPLFSRSGEVIGVLRALTYQPREFTQDEVDLLQQLASGAGIALENASLLEEIRNQAVALEKANSVKSEFLSFVSHELKDPLSVVMSYTDMLREEMFGEISSEQRKLLDTMARNGHKLLDLINSLLQATRIEAGGVEAEKFEVNLVDFIEELRSNSDVRAPTHVMLKWDYDADLPTVKTDGDKLRHILQNLINNAIKYTEEGHVTISVQVKEGGRQQARGSRLETTEILTRGARLTPQASTGFVEFKVTDTGIGIPETDLPFIFEKFRQVQGSGGRSGGSVGLGLHIVKSFTELLGGMIQVESELGKGSTFTVTIPC